MKQDITTHYQWSAGSPIAQVDVRTQKNGQSVAYLFADPSAPKETLLNIRAALRLKGWGTLSDHRDGKFGLRVSGIRKSEELIDLLSRDDFTTGTPSIQQSTIAEEVRPESLGQFVRNHSLTISGVLASVGNALSIASGFARGKDIGQIGQGVAFSLADLPLAIAGERDDNRQFSNLLRQLKKHYDKTGIDIPQTASINVETSDSGKGVGELTRDYLHRYANQIKCSLEVVAAGFTIHAGRKQKSPSKIMAASIFGPGFLASLLIPEKKIDAEKYAQAGSAGRLWMKIQEHPLSIGGILGYANTVFTYKSAIAERSEQSALKALGKPSTQHYRWDFTIPSVMIGANGTYAISKKTVGGDIRNEAMEGDVYRIAAQVLNKLPEEAREGAIESTAKFLGERPEVRDNHAQVRARLREEMAIQRQNPWFENITLPDRHAKVEAAPAPVLVPVPTQPLSPKTEIQAGEIQHHRQGLSGTHNLTAASAR